MLKRFILITGLLAAATPVAAQNLADVARAEEARRKAVKGEVKVYTNETLRGPDGGEAPTPRPVAAAPAAAPDTTAKPAAPAANKPGPSAGEPVKDEKFWRDRFTAARDALKRSQTFADALQTQ